MRKIIHRNFYLSRFFDEFLMILPGQVDGGRLRDLAERLIVRLQRPIPFNGQVCRVSGSAGIAVSHGGDMTVSTILARADAALYAAKDAGRGCAMIHGALPCPRGPTAVPPEADAGTSTGRAGFGSAAEQSGAA